jgi:hypothetical protein
MMKRLKLDSTRPRRSTLFFLEKWRWGKKNCGVVLSTEHDEKMSYYDDEDFENVPRNNVSMRAYEYRNKQPCTSYFT